MVKWENEAQILLPEPLIY